MIRHICVVPAILFSYSAIVELGVLWSRTDRDFYRWRLVRGGLTIGIAVFLWWFYYRCMATQQPGDVGAAPDQSTGVDADGETQGTGPAAESFQR